MTPIAGGSFYEALGWAEDGATRTTAIAGRIPDTELRYRRRIG